MEAQKVNEAVALKLGWTNDNGSWAGPFTSGGVPVAVTDILPDFYNDLSTHGPIVEKLNARDISLILISFEDGGVLCEYMKQNRMVMGYGAGPTETAARCLAFLKVEG